jgi:type I restriction enzyme, R subunit
MPSQHIEHAFETAIEEHLLGHGWHKGNPDHFDRATALDPTEVVRFIAETQAATWAELTRQHGDSVGKSVIEWLVKALDHQGALDVLRHGFKFMGKLLARTGHADRLFRAMPITCSGQGDHPGRDAAG